MCKGLSGDSWRYLTRAQSIPSMAVPLLRPNTLKSKDPFTGRGSWPLTALDSTPFPLIAVPGPSKPSWMFLLTVMVVAMLRLPSSRNSWGRQTCLRKLKLDTTSRLIYASTDVQVWRKPKIKVNNSMIWAPPAVHYITVPDRRVEKRPGKLLT